VSYRKYVTRLVLPALLLVSGSVLMLTASSRPAQAGCYCCDACSSSESKQYGTSGLLGLMFDNYHTIFEGLMGTGIQTIWEQYIGNNQSRAVMDTAQQKAATKISLADATNVNHFNVSLSEAMGKIVADTYVPSTSVCVQTSRLNQLRALEAKAKESAAVAQTKNLEMLSGKAGTIAEKGRIGATAALFSNSIANYNAVTLPGGMSGAAPRGANANINAVATIFDRDQIAGPDQLAAAKDVSTLIFAGALTGNIEGEQLSLPAARQQLTAQRRSNQAYAMAMSVFTAKIESLRDPTELGATVSPDSLFGKPASYQSLTEYYVGGLDTLNTNLRSQDNDRGSWQALAVQLDSNSRLLYKIFERSEQLALLRAFTLREHLDSMARGMGDISTPAMQAN